MLAAIVLTGCRSTPAATPAGSADPVTVQAGTPRDFPPAPVAPAGPLADDVAGLVQDVVGPIGANSFPDVRDVISLGLTDDVRVGWILADLLRLFTDDAIGTAAREAFNVLAGTTFTDPFSWREVSDLLIAWDLPAFPDYPSYKRQVFAAVEPGWQPFFDDEDSEVDWRIVSWGGVLIDDRPLDQVDEPCPRGCIPALDDPAVTDAAGGGWYPDDRLVFGVQIGDETRAYPKHQLEVHEMVNDELGGRRFALPYCTLCGSAQVWFTDEVAEITDAPERYELRTSGLLSRSNKVMYEFHTTSMFDTFTGEALTGPLREAGVILSPGTVVTATWGEWRAAHPDTTILAEDGGLGRSYDLDPLNGRDDDGPIFPIGDVDPRLPLQTSVLGVLLADGTAVAFPADAARAVLAAGGDVSTSGVVVTTDGAGLVASIDGVAAASHQAFWFAWSQFHEDTALWLPPS